AASANRESAPLYFRGRPCYKRSCRWHTTCYKRAEAAIARWYCGRRLRAFPPSSNGLVGGTNMRVTGGRRLLFNCTLSLMVAIAFAIFQVLPAAASFTIPYQIQGHVGYSTDALGQNGGGGTLQAEVPAGSTVEKAYLYGTYYQNGTPDVTARTIDFDGTT